MLVFLILLLFGLLGITFTILGLILFYIEVFMAGTKYDENRFPVVDATVVSIGSTSAGSESLEPRAGWYHENAEAYVLVQFMTDRGPASARVQPLALLNLTVTKTPDMDWGDFIKKMPDLAIAAAEKVISIGDVLDVRYDPNTIHLGNQVARDRGAVAMDTQPSRLGKVVMSVGMVLAGLLVCAFVRFSVG